MGASANTQSTPAIRPLSTEELEWLNACMRALVQETRANKAATPERAFNAYSAKDTAQ
ncbi:hypothetical protein ARMGADRAFT_1013555 [Armillaria gallica]|uniref:Uncharacterized protein n=1 Tax=Armillaria gallica TaxID=47427 RepID=A0A2H3D977_ARMGA|nr:hypothetical protein ARMGADRAFT_1013555 [Armillaria gallica]